MNWRRLAVLCNSFARCGRMWLEVVHTRYIFMEKLKIVNPYLQATVGVSMTSRGDLLTQLHDLTGCETLVSPAGESRIPFFKLQRDCTCSISCERRTSACRECNILINSLKWYMCSLRADSDAITRFEILWVDYRVSGCIDRAIVQIKYYCLYRIWNFLIFCSILRTKYLSITYPNSIQQYC